MPGLWQTIDPVNIKPLKAPDYSFPGIEMRSKIRDVGEIPGIALQKHTKSNTILFEILLLLI